MKGEKQEGRREERGGENERKQGKTYKETYS